jgi:signal transduction histidine kinase
VEIANKILFDCVNKALNQFDPDGKQVFYHVLEESYGMKPTEIAGNFELFHQVLKNYYGVKHFRIQTLIIRKMQENKALGLYEKVDERSAFILAVSVFGKEVEDHPKQVKEYFNLNSYIYELERKIDIYNQNMKSTERMAAIGETAAMVGHDIRNPLQAMISDVYLLKSELETMPNCETNEGIKESLDSLEKNIEYINKIVADLQDYAKLLKPEYDQVDITRLVTDLFKTVALPNNITLITDIQVPSQIRTEPTFMRRALTNLVNNAVQAMSNGGTLEIRVFINDKKLILSVSDTGDGIPEEIKGKLFTPMVTTKSKGQGFGLAVVKRLIEGLNGTITFESEVGKGTTFVIKLPTD